MPFSRCPHCRAEQLVPAALVGLDVSCRHCGSSFRAKQPAPSPGQSEPILSRGELVGTGRLMAALLIGLGLILCALYLIVSGDKLPTRATTPTAATTAPGTNRRGEVERRKREATAQDEQRRREEAVQQAVEIALGLVVLLYLVAVVVVAAWVARDAIRRGQPPDAWLAPYLGFHLFAPAVVVGVARAAGVVIGPLAAAVIVLGVQPLSWAGLFIYLFARSAAPVRAGRVRRTNRAG